VELPLLPLGSIKNLSRKFPAIPQGFFKRCLLPPLKRLRSSKRLIATIGSHPDSLIRAIQEFKSTRVMILHNFPEDKIGPLLDAIKETTNASLHSHSLNQLDIYETIASICEVIRQESDISRKTRWNTALDSFGRIMLQLGGGAPKLVTGTVYASFFCYDRISDFFYYPSPGAEPVHLPTLPWDRRKVENILPPRSDRPLECLLNNRKMLNQYYWVKSLSRI